MAKATYVVFSRPKPGREEEWNCWHRERHVHDVLALEGFVRCRRFRIPMPPQRPDVPAWCFAAIYEIDALEPAAVIAKLKSLFGTESMPTTDASDAVHTLSMLLEPCGEFGSEDLNISEMPETLQRAGVASGVLNGGG